MKIQLPQFQTVAEKRIPRTIDLIELRQSLVYEGLIEGLPTRERNAAKLGHIPEAIRHLFPWIPVAPYVITPVEVPIEFRGEKAYPFGDPARFPSVQCVSRWQCFEYGDENFDLSTLIIVWFQDEFALPIDAHIVEEITGLDWEKLSHKFEQ
ncbi:MAG: hypothetical protein KY445_11950 [Armatimonadetes bacterium]|nr:hypothetical protein [Armatimonadota bacterium]